MKYIKKFEELNINDSTYKRDDIVKIINPGKIINNNVGVIEGVGTFNDKFIYRINTLDSNSKLFWEYEITHASDEDIDNYMLKINAEKYNL